MRAENANVSASNNNERFTFLVCYPENQFCMSMSDLTFQMVNVEYSCVKILFVKFYFQISSFGINFITLKAYNTKA